MTDQHPKSHGALFTNNDKKNENYPDLRGNVEVSPDQIRRLIEMSQAGLEPKLQLAGWWKQPKGGGQTYLSMQAEAYMKQEESQPPQYPPEQQYGQQPQAGYAPQQQAPQPQAQPAPQPAPQPGNQPAGDFTNDDIPF